MHCAAVLSHLVVSGCLQPHGLYSPPGSSVHGDSPGKKTGVGCHALHQGVFPTQGLNPGLLHCSFADEFFYPLSHREWEGGPKERGYMCVCVADSFFHTVEITQHCNMIIANRINLRKRKKKWPSPMASTLLRARCALSRGKKGDTYM